MNKLKIYPSVFGAARLKAPLTLVTGVRSKEIKGFTDLETLINTIQTDQELLQFTEELRAARERNKAEYSKLKETKCRGFILGKFANRKDEECEVYLPLLGFDIDGIEDTFNALLILSECKKNPYVFAGFLSPSGRGLRLLVWCESSPENHKAYYEAFCKHLSESIKIPTDKGLRKRLKAEGLGIGQIKAKMKDVAHIDTATSNLSRIWFYTHSVKKEFYLNIDSKLFSIEEKRPTAIPKKITTPVKKVTRPKIDPQRLSLADKIQICEEMAHQRNIPEGRNNYVFVLACLMWEHGISKVDIIGHCGRYQEADFDEQEVKKTIDSATKKATFQKFSEAQIISYQKKSNINAKVVIEGEAKSVFKIIPQNEMKTNSEGSDYVEHPILKEKNNCYIWEGKDRKGKPYEYAISNFIINPLYHLVSSKNPKRIFEIVNKFGESSTVCLSVSSMVSKNHFNAAIEGKGNYIPDWNAKQLVAIKEKLYFLERKANEITVLGYQPEFDIYAFCNGVFDGEDFYMTNEFGIVSTKEHTYYLPALSSVNEDSKADFHNEIKFKFLNSPVRFKEWSRAIVNVYDENGKVGLCYLIAALFRDIIFSSIDFFPILFLFGQPRTGKSAFRESFLSLFGEPQTPISLGSASSAKGFARKLAQFSNGLIVFEEYKNNIKSGLIEMLKSMYDGIGYERAQMSNDNRTHSTPVLSACIVAGQEMPTKESALFSRSILLEFNKTKWDKSEDYNDLKTVEDEGVGAVLLEVLKHRNKISSGMKEAFHKIYKDFKKDHLTQFISDRNIKNVAAVIAPFKVLSNVLAFPFSYSEVYEVMKGKLVDQQVIMERTSEVNEFWSVFDYLCSRSDFMKGSHYQIEDKNGIQILYIRLTEVYPKYFDHATKQNLQVLDKHTLLKYLKQHPSYLRPPNLNRDDFKIRMSHGEPQKRVYAFKLNRLDLEL